MSILYYIGKKDRRVSVAEYNMLQGEFHAKAISIEYDDVKFKDPKEGKAYRKFINSWRPVYDDYIPSKDVEPLIDCLLHCYRVCEEHLLSATHSRIARTVAEFLKKHPQG